METTRVRYFLTEGEPLTLPRRTVEQLLRPRLARDILGLSADDIVSTDAVAIPLPRYEDGRPLRGRPGVKPTALRYPFMWLPAAQRDRYDIATGEGETTVESDDVWAFRVCLEMWIAGAYNVETGGWIDVLALWDLDPEDPETAERIQRWWDGSDDEVLDSIDLTDAFAVAEDDDADWAIISASTIEPLFTNAAMALSAADILGLCDLVEDGETSPLGGGNAIAAIPVLVNVAQSRFTRNSEAFLFLDRLYEKSKRSYSSSTEIIEAILPDLRDMMSALFEAYYPDLVGVVDSDLAEADEQLRSLTASGAPAN